MSLPAPSKPRFESIDGLRGLACLLVLLYHSCDHFGKIEWPGTRQVVYSFLLISDSFNGSFWTLPVEWRWYFVLPVLIWLWKRIGGAGVLLCLIPISLVSIFVYMPSHQEHLKFLVSTLPTFLPLFGLGIWAASLASGQEKSPWERQVIRWAPFGVIATFFIVIAFAPLNIPPFNSRWFLLRLVTWGPLCFLLVLAATQDGRIHRFLSWRPLVWVGTFSYSLYLTHEPLLSMAAALILPHHLSTAGLLFCEIIVMPLLLVGFGYLFFLVAEKPFLRRPVKKAIEAEQHGLATAKATAEA